MALVLDPAFAGRGERVQETLALVAGALVLAAAVERARRVTLDRAAEAFRRRRVERAFGRHVPEAVAARLAAEPDGFPPTLHDATVLHLDAEGFTAFAAGRPPAEVLAALDALLALAGEEVARRGGVVTGFAGDSLLAVFGAPLLDPSHPAQALAAARAILARAGETRLAVRIGIATGPLAAGLVGGAARQAYTVYGETVNRAQRLEAANKRDGGRLLVSAETAARLGPGAGLVPAEPVAAAGFAEPIPAWRPG
jgi:class 3 adenylate cyclase